MVWVGYSGSKKRAGFIVGILYPLNLSDDCNVSVLLLLTSTRHRRAWEPGLCSSVYNFWCLAPVGPLVASTVGGWLREGTVVEVNEQAAVCTCLNYSFVFFFFLVTTGTNCLSMPSQWLLGLPALVWVVIIWLSFFLKFSIQNVSKDKQQGLGDIRTLEVFILSYEAWWTTILSLPLYMCSHVCTCAHVCGVHVCVCMCSHVCVDGRVQENGHGGQRLLWAVFALLHSTLFSEAGFVFSLDLRVSVRLAADLQGPAWLHSPVLGFCRLMLLLGLQTQVFMILSKLFAY